MPFLADGNKGFFIEKGKKECYTVDATDNVWQG